MSGLAIAMLLAGACANLLHFRRLAASMPPPGAGDPSYWEARLGPVRARLWKKGYTSGRLGFVTSGRLAGLPRSGDDGVRWGLARYVMAPLDVVENDLAAPFVVVDWTTASVAPAIPEGLTTLYDSGNGILLLEPARSPR